MDMDNQMKFTSAKVSHGKYYRLVLNNEWDYGYARENRPAEDL